MAECLFIAPFLCTYFARRIVRATSGTPFLLRITGRKDICLSISGGTDIGDNSSVLRALSLSRGENPAASRATSQNNTRNDGVDIDVDGGPDRRSPYLKQMLAALEHGSVTHDGGRHVPRVSHKNTLCTWSPLLSAFLPILPSYVCLSRRPSRSAGVRKINAMQAWWSVVSATGRGERGSGGQGSGKTFLRTQ